MTQWKILLAGSASLLALMHPGVAPAADVPRLDMDTAYSATRIIEADKQRIEQRYFHHSATTNRMETTLRGQESIMILRADQNLMWTIMPQRRMYMEMLLDSGQATGAPEMPDTDRFTEVREVGRESVNGVPATKYYVTSEDDGRPTQGHLWVSDHGIPVQMDLTMGKDRVRMELRDLVVGAQPAALFEAPAGYQRLAIGGDPGGVLESLKGMRVGGPGAPPAAPAAAAPQTYPTDPDAAPPAPGEPGFVGELAEVATEEAKQATKDEVRGTVRESVSKGLRDLLRGR
jgi:hypothetical protein